MRSFKNLKNLIAVVLIAIGVTFGATPPSLINYQGVLRDDTGQPLDGGYNMTFRFFDADVGGNEILSDAHDAGGSGDVTVTDGLFDVKLGSGNVADGIGPGVYNSLTDVFRDHTTVWMEIQVGAETLSPRVQVISSAFALNSDRLDSRDASYFLDTSATTQAKSGHLLLYGGLDLGPGVNDELYAADVQALTGGGNGDGFHTHPLLSDADTLQGLLPHQLLRADTNETFYGGTLSVPLGSTLAVGGTFRASAFTDDDDANYWVDPNSITALNGLSVKGSDFFLNQDGPDDTSYIYFYNTGSPNGEYIRWYEPAERFELTDDIFTESSITADKYYGPSGSSYFLNLDSDDTISGRFPGDLTIGYAPDPYPTSLYFEDETKYLRYDGATFEMNDDLAVNGTLNANTVSALNFNTNTINSSGDIVSYGKVTATRFSSWTGGFYIDPEDPATSAELAGDISVGKGSTSDSDYIYFDGYAEHLAWQEANGRFYFSDDLAGAGGLNFAGTSSTGTLAVNGALTAANISSGGGISGTDITASGVMLANTITVSTTAFALKFAGHAGSGSYYLAPDAPTSGFLAGDLQIGQSSSSDDDYIVFDAASEHLMWNNTNDRFELSDDLSFESTFSTARRISNAYDLELHQDSNNDNTNSWFRVYTNGGTIEQMRITDDDEAGASFDGTVTANGLDYAEAFQITDRTLEAGDVVTLELDTPGYVKRSTGAYASHLVGVISDNAGFLTGGGLDAEKNADPELAARRDQARAEGDLETEKQLSMQLIERKNEQQRPVALVGRVPVKVDGAYGRIRPGDRLTSSATPGHAMAMDRPGPSIGIALEGWSGPRKGKILVFIQSGHHEFAEAPGEHGTANASEAEANLEPVQTTAGNLQIVLDRDGNDEARFSVQRDGNGGLGAEVFRVDEQGNVFAKGSFRPTAMDVAEYQPVSEPAEAGDVLVVDLDRPGMLCLGREAADPAVVGIVSHEPGVLLGSGLTRIAAADPGIAAELDQAREIGDTIEEARLWAELQTAFREIHAPLALTGTVPCKVDAGYGAIRPGDLLTSSPTPGHAMRATDAAPGTVIAKALASLESGTGVIKVMLWRR